MKAQKAVLLVGHGATASDTPRELVGELKRLEAQRAPGAPMSPREAEVDARVRRWPRTAKTDPYQAGVEAIASALRKALPGRKVLVAYNEFCAPAVDEALDALAADGTREITVVSTMLTRGGVHSETEIPSLIKQAKARHPGLTIRYAWPFDADALAGLLGVHVRRTEKRRS
jgi:sirohydrochlorin cobaltochelatase